MFWKLSAPKPNGPLVAQLFLKILDVKLSATTLQHEIEDHPNYPSLLSIGDVFSKYNVEHVTASFSPTQLRGIPPPYITQLKGETDETDYFTVVSEVADEKVRMFDPEKRKWNWFHFDDLVKRSSGIVLLAEANPDAGEHNYKVNRREERLQKYGYFLLIGLVLAIFGTAIGKSLALQGWDAILPILFFIAGITGAFLGVLLIWYDLDHYNPVIQQICKTTKHINCNAILQSNAAKIGGVSWSVIGTSYFAGTLLLLLLQGITGKVALVIMGWLSLCVTPFVLFSVYYQWRIVKQWCLLCLLVQGVLLLQALISWRGKWIQISVPETLMPENAVPAIAFYIIPLLVLILLLPVLKGAKHARRYKRDLNRLKYDPIVFDALLKKQKNIHDSSDGIGILIGNPNAKNRILKVCNPYCGPCAQAHTPIEELLQSNPDVQLQIIFTASIEETDYKKLPVRHFLSIAANRDEPALKQALADWYLAKEKSYEPFAMKYPIAEDPALHDTKIAAMHNWCKHAGILHTPTIFINNYEVPEIYSIHDLKRFLIA